MNFKTASRRELFEAHIAHMIPDTRMRANVGSERRLHSKGPETMGAL